MIRSPLPLVCAALLVGVASCPAQDRSTTISSNDDTIVKSDRPLPAGKSVVTVEFDSQGTARGGPARVTLGLDRKKIAKGKLEETVGYRFGIGTFGIGEDSGQPDTFDIKPPFHIHR